MPRGTYASISLGFTKPLEISPEPAQPAIRGTPKRRPSLQPRRAVLLHNASRETAVDAVADTKQQIEFMRGRAQTVPRMRFVAGLCQPRAKKTIRTEFRRRARRRVRNCGTHRLHPRPPLPDARSDRNLHVHRA